MNTLTIYKIISRPRCCKHRLMRTFPENRGKSRSKNCTTTNYRPPSRSNRVRVYLIKLHHFYRNYNFNVYVTRQLHRRVIMILLTYINMSIGVFYFCFQIMSDKNIVCFFFLLFTTTNSIIFFNLKQEYNYNVQVFVNNKNES